MDSASAATSPAPLLAASGGARAAAAHRREFLRQKRALLASLSAAAVGTEMPAAADEIDLPVSVKPPTPPSSPSSASSASLCVEEQQLVGDLQRLQRELALRKWCQREGEPGRLSLVRALESNDEKIRAVHPALQRRRTNSKCRRHPRDVSAAAAPSATYTQLHGAAVDVR
eukprot:TRINITY_DN26347_c0_g1_i1.p1 TRINITY_DN26347_c0_g1~~TRINITY_DN26347_c0_g1_i1.p1  ORF type:complete len:193 (+),score=59.19 TRINITY_DN26347_c0_g1_i1:68-580(+)